MVQRRLAAILAADVVGYSRMMERDEIATLERLQTLRRELLDPLVAGHGGRIVKLIGDGALVEFASVVAAVECAVKIQSALAERNAGAAAGEALVMRIGINLGDVIVEGDDLYGDGVNIAARLEGEAEPGGICIADNAHRQVRGRVAAEFRDAGELKLKNIAEPQRAWRWTPPGVAMAPAPGEVAAAPVAAERPSIIVLPFANLSGDSEQDFFADGLTEDLITGLSRFAGLFVIARGSSFVYKGKTVRPQDLNRELGVRYVAQGSVRRAGKRVRVTIELVDALSGARVWGERYDREVEDLFEVEDDITRRVCAALPGRLEHAESGRLLRKPTEDLAAYECLLRAKLCHHSGTREANAEALRLLDQALAMDPEFGDAFAWKACTIGQAMVRGYPRSPGANFAVAGECVRRGLAIDPNNLECHRILCEIAMGDGDWDGAERHHERAFALNPNDPRIVAQRAELMTWIGKPDEGAGWAEQAMQLDPFEAPNRARFLGRALLAARRHGEAIAAFKQIAAPRYSQCADLAGCYAATGEMDKARAASADALRLKPDFSVTAYVDDLPYRRPADREHHREILLKAGLPA